MTRMFLLAGVMLATVAGHAQEKPKLPTQQETLAKWPWSIELQAMPFQQQRVQFTLAPKEGMEYKYRLEKGAALVFSWTATAPVHYELHSEPDAGPKGYAETFDKHDSRDTAHASYVAPFSGIHGWYWENRTGNEVIIRLVSAGHYTESLEFRRKQDVKRKAFN